MQELKLKSRRRRNENCDISDNEQTTTSIKLGDFEHNCQRKDENENEIDDFKTALFAAIKDEEPKNQVPTSDDDDESQLNESNELFKAINRPQETNFTQQRLMAWKPMLTPKFVINLFLICSILFLPIGVILYFTSNNIYEFRYDYTDCQELNKKTTTTNRTCHERLIEDINNVCKCRIYFTEDRFQDETLLIYYMLDNYFQNARKYVRSVDNYQLLGRKSSPEQILNEYCEPYRQRVLNNVNYGVAPCGAIANSLFNDTFNIFYLMKNSNESIKLNISKTDIAWEWDKQFKYKNPVNLDFNKTIKPPNWSFNITQLKSSYESEDLIVWMRTAAFPSFRKLYGRILLEENARLAHKSNRSYLYRLFELSQKNKLSLANSTATNIEIKFTNITETTILRLPKGHYYVDIDYRYPVKQFGGRKFFVLANVSWLGGKCYFLALSYIIMGSICFITSILLFFIHIYYGNMDYDTAILLVDQKSSRILDQRVERDNLVE